MTVLNLTLKKQWFDLIALGEHFRDEAKLEEYREIKDYWINTLTWHEYHGKTAAEIIELGEKAIKSRFYDVVRFRNGYAADAPEITVECKGIRIGEGKTEWGAVPGQQYFVIELGQILKPVNL